MSKDFNPFIDAPRASKKPDAKEKAVSDFTAYLLKKANDGMAHSSPESHLFVDEENKEWLLEELDDLLEMDNWSRDDIARLSAITFYLLTTGRDFIEASEGEEP